RYGSTGAYEQGAAAVCVWGGGRGRAYVQQALVGGAREGRRSTAMRAASGSARPADLSRMASASSLKARSMFTLAFADVSMNRMLCSRAICNRQRPAHHHTNRYSRITIDNGFEVTPVGAALTTIMRIKTTCKITIINP
ncbi:hypothetical protein MSG28_005411, partial [Choristoneura fumiferana]